MTITAEIDLDQVEIWEATTDASTWLWIVDQLAGKGSWKKQKVGGQYGNKRIAITVRERRYNQDQIPENNARFDPFLNGSLICRQGSDQSPNGYTDAQLIELLQVPIEQDAAFKQVVEGITSELLMRRLLGLAERNASRDRQEMLQDLVDERYRVGYTQRSLRTDIPDTDGIGNGVLVSR